jgi:hypothetical protein
MLGCLGYGWVNNENDKKRKKKFGRMFILLS